MRTRWWQRILVALGLAPERKKQPWIRERLQFEMLEDRLAPAATITSTNAAISILVPAGETVTVNVNAPNHYVITDAAGISAASTGGAISGVGNTIFTASDNTPGQNTFTILGGAGSGGTVQLLAAVIPDDTAFVINAGTFDLNGFSETIDELNGSGSTITNSGAAAATLTVGDDNGSGSYGGVMQDGASALAFTKTGNGIETLSGLNTYTGATTISDGTIALGVANALPTGTALSIANSAILNLSGFSQTVGSVTGSGTVTSLVGTPTFTVNDAGAHVFAGTLAGTLSLAKDGAGTLTLQTANTYGGLTTILDGTIAADGVNNVLNPATSLSISATGTFEMAGNSQQVASLNGSGTVDSNAGTPTFKVTNDGSFAGTLTGTLSLRKEGAGTLTLQGASTYTGSTAIVGGILANGTADALPTTTALTVDPAGAVFNLAGSDQTVASLTGSGTVTSSVGTPTFTVSSGVFAGQITGGGLKLTKSGAGILTLSGVNNNYGGATSITDGTLKSGHDDALPVGTSLTIDPGAFFDLAGNDQTVTFIAGSGTVTNSGGAALFTVNNDVSDDTFAGLITGAQLSLAKSGSKTLTLTLPTGNTYGGATSVSNGTLKSGAVNALPTGTDLTVDPAVAVFDLAGFNQTVASVVGSGTVTNTGGAALFTVNVNAADDSFAGLITGANLSLAKSGTKTLTLTLPTGNTYGGATSVSNGTLKSGTVNALPTGTDLTVDPVGAVFDLAGFDQTVASLAGSGTVTSSVGTPTFTVNSGVFAGQITGGGLKLTKSGAGTLTLSGVNNNYGGATSVSNGTLKSGALNALPTGTDLTVDPVGAVFDLAGFNQTVASLAGSGTVTSSVGTPTFTVNSGVFAGQITGGGLNLTKSGAGTLTLNGVNNNYGGATSITNGTLASGHANALPTTTSLDVSFVATFELNGHSQQVAGLTGSGTVTNSGAAAPFIISNAGADVFGGTITGAITLFKAGGGMLTLQGASTYTGATNIADGTVAAGTTNALPIATTLNVSLNASFDLNGFSQQVASVNGLGTVTNTGAAATFIVNNAVADAFLGTLTGANLALTKANLGTLTLNGTNNYGGATTITGGTLRVPTSLSASSASVVSLAGANVVLDGFGTGQILRPVIFAAAANFAQITNLTVNSSSAAVDGITVQAGATSLFVNTVTVTGSNKGINVAAGFASTLTITNSTISTNAGIGLDVAGGTVDPIHVTVAANAGGGARRTAGIVRPLNSLFANPTFDFSGTVTSQGFNLFQTSAGVVGLAATDIVNQPARLAPLSTNYGGSIATHALLPGSAALDAVAVDLAGLATDQRGLARPAVVGSFKDIGAFESRGFTVTRIAVPNGAGTLDAPAGDTAFRGLIDRTFVTSDGGTPLQFAVQVTAAGDPGLADLTGGAITFGGPAGAVPSAAPTAPAVLLDATGIAQTAVVANNFASLPATNYNLVARAAANVTLGGLNNTTWKLFNQKVTSLFYNIPTGNGLPARPMNAQSGNATLFKSTNGTTSPIVTVTMLDQDVVPRPVVITGETVALQAAYTGVVLQTSGLVPGDIQVISVNHGLVTGQRVTINGVVGNTAANGTFTITVLDVHRFTLNGTLGNGPYLGGGTFSKGAINATTGPGVGPIVVTSVNHDLQHGQQVTISGVLGNTAANGTFTVSVIDADHFALNGTLGNGPYLGGGSFDKGFINSVLAVPGRPAVNLIGGVASTTTVAGVAYFMNVKIYQSTFYSPYVLKAVYTNPAPDSTRVVTSTSQFRIVPMHFSILGGNFAGALQTAYNITVAQSDRGTIRLLNVVAGENGLSTNQLLTRAFDFFSPGVVAPANTYDGPVFLTFGVDTVSVGPNINFLANVPTMIMMTNGVLFLPNVSPVGGVPANGFAVAAEFGLLAVPPPPNTPFLFDPTGSAVVNAGVPTTLFKATFARINLGRLRGR